MVVGLSALLSIPACTETVELFGIRGLLTRGLAQRMLPCCAGGWHTACCPAVQGACTKSLLLLLRH